MRRLLALGWLLALPLAAQDKALEFQPKVGAIGSRVVVTGIAVAPGIEVRFGNRVVPVLREASGFSFLVPAGAATGFVEVVQGGRPLAKSAVPFVVTGTSLVSAPKLIGLKEAIDVFGYAEPVPEAKMVQTKARPILKLDDEDVLTIGETGPPQLGPAVQLSDSASAGTQGMGAAGFLITARAPKKKYTVPPPPSP